MKPVKEIALILDVSQVTVYNHINKIKDDIKAHIFNVKGATYLDEEGIRQLKISMGLLQVPEIRENITMDNIINEISDSVTKKITNNIKKNYEELQEEISEVYRSLEEKTKEDNNNLLEELKKVKKQNKDIQDQNKILINLIEDQQNKTLIEKFKNLFKKDKK